jgi:predicted TIM-barrel fold metal-dependent hydrolase
MDAGRGHARVVRGLEIELGYLPYGPDSLRYRPYFELAAEFKVPFIFHTGDTYSPTARVKYAHPLLVDDVAVDHRDVDFVLAHFGNPWLIDAAEVVYKNPNVWADLSGLVVGDDATLREQLRGGFPPGLLTSTLQQMFLYTGKADRFLYGSDWPLSPMAVYRDLIRKLLPEDTHQQVFEDNARKLFKLV